MKEYPLTKGELRELGAVGIFATLFFSLSSFCTAVWLDIVRDLAFASVETKESVKTYWQAWQTASGWAAIAFAVIGLVFLGFGYFRVREIIRETNHSQ
jgi:hypothetical protein